MTNVTTVLRRMHAVEGVGAVSLIECSDGTFDVIQTDHAGVVTNGPDDMVLASEGEAALAFLRALEYLDWLSTAPGRNAARDIAIDDATRGGRHA